MIEIHELYKQFGNVAAVRGVSFQAPDGAITGLLGANGAGKTTTLRMIGGLLKPQRGSVRIDDGGMPASIGALLDHTGLYPRLTARENIAYFGELQGISGPRLKERVEEVLALLGLQSAADRRAAGFSQGERMKTALGRALVHSPRNIVLDEPTNGLDVPSVRSLRSILMRLRDAGACLLFSSHILEEVRALCDNVVIISKGCLVAQGSPDELCRQAGRESLEDAFVKLTEVAAC
jgi:sodium transport system ATP-binding protein